MLDRRRFVRLSAFSAAAAGLAACGTPSHPLPATGAVALTAGSVTNPTGTVAGNDLTTLKDAYAGNFGGLQCPADVAMAQWQMLVLLSNAADACTSGNPFLAGELTVRFVFVGYRELPDCAPVYPPAADLPLTWTLPNWRDTSDGVHRSLAAYFNKARSNGQAGNDVQATGGTVTFTAMDATSYQGSYNLQFPSGGSAAGSFVAPWCGTAPTNP